MFFLGKTKQKQNFPLKTLEQNKIVRKILAGIAYGNSLFCVQVPFFEENLLQYYKSACIICL